MLIYLQYKKLKTKSDHKMSYTDNKKNKKYFRNDINYLHYDVSCNMF